MVGEMEAGQNRLMNLDGRPTGDLCSAVKENFHQANHARVVNFDARKMSGADLSRKRQALEQGKIHVDVEPLRLKFGKPIGDGQEFLTHRIQVIEPLF